MNKFLIFRDENNNVEMFADAGVAPTPYETSLILEWYRRQPHHDKDWPENNARVVISTFRKDGIVTPCGHARYSIA